VSRRIELELTSGRDDGSWTWRAAGALQPRGELDGSLLPPGSKVGDVLRAEADFTVDGITVVSVLPPKAARVEPERIELRPPARELQPVVTTLAPRTERRGRSPRRDRDDDRGDRPDRARRDRPRPEGARGEDRDRGRPARGGRPGEGARGADRSPRRERPAPPPPKPKPKKLRPGRVNRDALLATLPPEQHPIAEQLFRGGIPAVRTAITEQNRAARSEGKPEIPEATVLNLAENLAPAVRLADWLDRAAAAAADAEVIALKDLRAVVHAADDVVREDATRPRVAELRAVLDRRAAAEQQEWVDDIARSLTDGRVVRALRLASRSPQPNESLPAELTTRLTEAASAALTPDAAPDRWATVVDAVAYSPVRRAVTPVGAPAEPGDELLAAVRKHAARVPKVAALFGIEAPARSAPKPRPKAAPRRAAEVQAEAGLLPPPPGGPRRIPPPPSPAGPAPSAAPGPDAMAGPVDEGAEPAVVDDGPAGAAMAGQPGPEGPVVEPVRAGSEPVGTTEVGARPSEPLPAPATSPAPADQASTDPAPDEPAADGAPAVTESVEVPAEHAVAGVVPVDATSGAAPDVEPPEAVTGSGAEPEPAPEPPPGSALGEGAPDRD
jgi:hypothetical protein